MNLELILEFLLFGLCIFSGFLIYIMRNIDTEIDIEKYISVYGMQVEESKKKLEEGNKLIDKLEEEILYYKKKLK